MSEVQKTIKLTLGWKVFAGLMALTVVEFWFASLASGPIPYPVLCGLLAPITWLAVSVSQNPLPYLGVAAVAKAILIVRYFMLIAKAWAGEGEH